MLEIRPVCENCGKNLPYNSTDARICSFECTFCSDCVDHVLHNVCPNCGGGFERRPIRPQQKLVKYPPKKEEYQKSVNLDVFHDVLEKNRNVPPHLR
jgi:hypothetical protein